MEVQSGQSMPTAARRRGYTMAGWSQPSRTTFQNNYQRSGTVTDQEGDSESDQVHWHIIVNTAPKGWNKRIEGISCSRTLPRKKSPKRFPATRPRNTIISTGQSGPVTLEIWNSFEFLSHSAVAGSSHSPMPRGTRKEQRPWSRGSRVLQSCP